MTPVKLTFKPKQAIKTLLSALPDRAQEVLIKRYGLGGEPKRQTLEAIGKTYSITRERVRQIENYALSSIRKSDQFKKSAAVFQELESHMGTLGGVIAEDELLDSVSKDQSTQNHIHFPLVIGEAFT